MLGTVFKLLQKRTLRKEIAAYKDEMKQLKRRYPGHERLDLCNEAYAAIRRMMLTRRPSTGLDQGVEDLLTRLKEPTYTRYSQQNGDIDVWRMLMQMRITIFEIREWVWTDCYREDLTLLTAAAAAKKKAAWKPSTKVLVANWVR